MFSLDEFSPGHLHYRIKMEKNSRANFPGMAFPGGAEFLLGILNIFENIQTLSSIFGYTVIQTKMELQTSVSGEQQQTHYTRISNRATFLSLYQIRCSVLV